MVAVARPFSTKRPQEREDVLIHHFHHFAGFEILEARPAQVLIGTPLLIFAVWKDAAFHWRLEGLALALFQGVEVVQPLDEQQIGHLLHDRKRIGDPARPKVVPNTVNLVSDFAGQHSAPCLSILVLFLYYSTYSFCQGAFKLSPVRHHNRRLVRIVQNLRNIKPQSFSEVVKKRLPHRDRNLAV